MSASEKLRRGEERGVGFVEAAFGFCPGEGGAGEFGVAVFEHGEDAVELCEQGEGGVGVGAVSVVAVGGGVDGAEHVEDGGAGFGGVEVVGEGGGEGGVAGGDER